MEISQKNPKNVVGRKERKEVMDELLFRKSGLSKLVRKLKDDKILINTGGRDYQINPVFMPEFDENGQFSVTFTMIKTE